jgi:DNA-binding NarL/FixJ family response regulator
VLQLLAAGLSNKEIGRTLSIQVPTVKNHVRSIFAKLRIRNRSQAAAWTHLMEWGTGPPAAQRTGT